MEKNCCDLLVVYGSPYLIKYTNEGKTMLMMAM